MNQEKSIFNAAASSKFASILSQENMTINFSNTATTACISLDMRDVTLPTYSKTLPRVCIEGYILHEVLGHALHTPILHELDGVEMTIDIIARKLKFPFSVLNVIEDARIENIAKQKYPGAESIFNAHYKELYFIQTKFIDDVTTINSLKFIDRFNIFAKVGPLAGVIFSADEMVLVNELMHNETFDEVINSSVKVWELIKESQKKEESQDEESQDEESQDEESQDEESQDEESQDEESQDEESNDEESNDEESNDEEWHDEESNDEESQDEESQDEESQDEESNDEEDFVNSDSDFDMNPDTYQSETEDNLKEALRDDAPTPSYIQHNQINIPKVTLAESKKIFIDSKSVINILSAKNEKTLPRLTKLVGALLSDFKKYGQKSAKHLAATYETNKSAKHESRSKIYKSGEINEDMLSEYKTATDIFLENETHTDGKNHGFFTIIDLSFSMMESVNTRKNNASYASDIRERFYSDDYLSYEYINILDSIKYTPIYNVIMQLYIQALFCKECDIPLESYGFTTSPIKAITLEFIAQRKACGAKTTDHYAIALFNNTMSKSNMDLIITELLTTIIQRGRVSRISFGGTPTNDVLFYSLPLISKFKKDNSIQKLTFSCIQDGASGFSRIDQLNNCVHPNHMGLIFDENSKTYIPKIKNNSAKDLRALPNLLISMLKANVDFVFNIISVGSKIYDILNLNGLNKRYVTLRGETTCSLEYNTDAYLEARAVTLKHRQYTIPNEFCHPAIDNEYLYFIKPLRDDVISEKPNARQRCNEVIAILNNNASQSKALRLINTNMIKNCA